MVRQSVRSAQDGGAVFEGDACRSYVVEDVRMRMEMAAFVCVCVCLCLVYLGAWLCLCVVIECGEGGFVASAVV